MYLLCGTSLVFAALGLVLVVVAVTTRGSADMRCGFCGYRLVETGENRCPECGRAFLEAGIEKRPSSRIRHSLYVGMALLGFGLVGTASAVSLYYRKAASSERQARQTERAFLQQVLEETSRATDGNGKQRAP